MQSIIFTVPASLCLTVYMCVLCVSVSSAVVQRERREERDQARLDRERLRALRADDEEGYLRLLQESKNDRLIGACFKNSVLLLDYLLVLAVIYD